MPLVNKLKQSFSVIKKISSASAFISSAIVLLLLLAGVQRASAVPVGLSITGGSDVNGLVDADVAITDVQVSGTTSDAVSVDLFVPYGNLSMTTTTGLTFVIGPTGQRLYFTGSLSDVNTALATLHYHSDKPQNIQLSVALTAEDEVYNPENGHLYQVVNLGENITADDARVAAAAQTKYGLNGYLVTITSKSENDFIYSRVNTNSWMGATDAPEEGVWKWDQGPEAGTQFWQGKGNTGSVVEGRYSNWANGEPNDSSNSEDCGEYYTAGKWNDLPCNYPALSSYIVEYGSDGNLPTLPHKSVNISVSYPAGNATTINNCSDLVNIAAHSADYRYDTITLGQDISCDGTELAPLFATHDNTLGWLSFRGTFDGNGHTITDFSVNNGTSYTSLFGVIQDATIENLTLDSVTVSSSNSCVGVLAGSVQNTTISNVHVTNSHITGNADVGGLVGCMSVNVNGYSFVDSSFTTGTVGSSNDQTSGLVAEVTVDGGVSFSITSNQVSATIVGQNVSGGLIGEIDLYNGSQSSITQNNITNGTLNGGYLTGGLIGYSDIDGGSQLEIDQNTVSQSVIGNDDTGGLIGALDAYGGSDFSITNNTITSMMEGTNYTAGLAGYLDSDGGASALVSDNFVNVLCAGNYAVAGLIGEYDNYDAQQVVIQRNMVGGLLSGGSNVGGLVGYMYLNGVNELGADPAPVLVDSNLVNMGISAYSGTVGGLIGYMETYYSLELTTSRNIYAGSIEGSPDGPVGGLVGEVYNESYNGDTIIHLRDSYTDADIEGSNSVGGAIGYVDVYSEDGDSHAQLDVQRIYTAGSVAGDEYLGGLVGYIEQIDSTPTTVTLSGNFTVASVTPHSEAQYLGAMVGYFDQGDNHLVTKNNYYDRDALWSDVCSGGVSVEFDCNPVNLEGSQPNYFKLNNTNAPLNTWDFANIWGTSDEFNEGLPCLQFQDERCAPADDGDNDGIANEVENAAPNNGDANHDGIADSSQRNVSSFVNTVDGSYAVVQTSCSDNYNVQIGAESSESKDESYQYPAGLVSFVGRDCGDPGATANVTLFFFGDYDPAQFVLRKWDGHQYITVSDAVLTQVTIGGHTALKAQYQITDGGTLDQDGIADGNIVDPVGIALRVAQPVSSSHPLASTGTNARKFMAYALSLTLLSVASYVIVATNKKITP